jgi:RsiW-degrading membrane proteinase PrsW (M82 family)
MTFTVLIYALLAGLLPSLVWLWFWLREDSLHPEPRTIIAMTFIAGCISVIIAIIFENFVQQTVADETTRYIVWAAIEEIVKFCAVALVAFHANIVDEPIDGMIYCITVALGFAALENAFFIFSPLHLGQISTSIVTGNLRFIGATLLHIVSSASIGFMVGLTFYRGIFIKIVGIICGIILAITLHASFNLAIIYGTAMTTLKVFGWVWCAVVILIILFEEVKAVHPKQER